MSLTVAQQKAVAARGNVLVSAAAGTGKTSTLTARCLDCLNERDADGSRVSLENTLVVTFTEAAAADMRKRLRIALDEKITEDPGDIHWQEQLALFDVAHIGTLHGLCLKLVHQHFHAPGLDPQFRVADQGEARLLAQESLDVVLQSCYEGKSDYAEAVQRLIQFHGGGRENEIRSLVQRIHDHTQTRPDPAGWFYRQLAMFNHPEPVQWREWLLEGVAEWRNRWLPELASLAGANLKAAECADILKSLLEQFTREQAADILEALQAAGQNWPKNMKTKLEPPLKPFFADVEFLCSTACVKDGKDPLAQDWEWTRAPMIALLRLAQDFTAQFTRDKRSVGLVDFHDLEQFALLLLADENIAGHWRDKIRYVFVDEYQDINAAQDKIIERMSRDKDEANRFLVGDVKQSIYRFRQAAPTIFRRYAQEWRSANNKTLSLTENFRSREGVLEFANSVFGLLFREDLGGVDYDDDARLKFGAAEQRANLSLKTDSAPRVKLLLRVKGDPGDGAIEAGAMDDPAPADEDIAALQNAEKEARLVAQQLRKLKNDGHLIWDEKKNVERAADWSDMAVLLRAPFGKAEGWAREFHKAGVPLVVERGGFFDNTEVTDLLSLLTLLDNPLQDLPLLAVLRSPLVGLSLDELAEIRSVVGGRFWTALVRWREVSHTACSGEMFRKVDSFLSRHARWRELARQSSLSRCLETILRETRYDDWLRGQRRGEQRFANVQRLLGLAQQFDEFQQQGLFRFLRFIEAQRKAETEPDVAATVGANAVRLMSIHQSKGLEFHVVVLADLGKAFNQQDLNGAIILEETFGLCPQIKPPRAGGRYPSLPHWLARRREKRELWGEEMRLLYVAMTRARDTLLLSAGISKKKFEVLWQTPRTGDVGWREALDARSYADWLGLWFGHNGSMTPGQRAGALPLLNWELLDDSTLNETEEAGESRDELGLQPPELDEATFQRLHGAMTWSYSFTEATRHAAKTSVTALRRQAADELDDEAAQLFPAHRGGFQSREPRGVGKGKLSATETGTAHHKFQQYVSLAAVGGLQLLKAEASRMKAGGVLTAEEADVLDLEALAAFWKSDVGVRIRERAGNVKRELPFTARFVMREVDSLIHAEAVPGVPNTADDFVVVQGVADLVVLLEKEIWLLDFKTDAVGAAELQERTELYAPQLKLYALALSRIYGRPVTQCWLHFLAQNKTVSTTP